MKVKKIKTWTHMPIRKDKNEKEQKSADMEKEAITWKMLVLCFHILHTMCFIAITILIGIVMSSELGPFWFIAHWFILIPLYCLIPCYHFYILIKEKELPGKQTLETKVHNKEVKKGKVTKSVKAAPLKKYFGISGQFDLV